MIRKQVYLGEEHDRKVKAIARRRGCSEAEVIREAIEHLPEPKKTLGELLQEAGADFLPADPALPVSEELARLEQEIERWAATIRPEDGLAEAILANRAEEDDRVR